MSGEPFPGPQMRAILFSATVSAFEAEQGAYELRIRGWRKHHVLNVSPLPNLYAWRSEGLSPDDMCG